MELLMFMILQLLLSKVNSIKVKEQIFLLLMNHMKIFSLIVYVYL